jgi:uncharacterized membrane protein (DUF441 family)
VACAVLFASYDLVHGELTEQLRTLVALAGLGGVAASVTVAWTLGRGLATFWRRLLVTTMALMGTVLALFLTTVADLLAGRWGVGAFGALCLAVIGAAYRLFLAKPA